jgi:hypothetical protein
MALTTAGASRASSNAARRRRVRIANAPEAIAPAPSAREIPLPRNHDINPTRFRHVRLGPVFIQPRLRLGAIHVQDWLRY